MGERGSRVVELVTILGFMVVVALLAFLLGMNVFFFILMMGGGND